MAPELVAVSHANVAPNAPREARDLRDVGGSVHHRGRLLDRHGPVVADRVPVQLVVVGERVHLAAHAVHDVVGVLAADRPVGIADLDALVVAVLLDGVLRRRVGRTAHRHDVQRVDAVVAVLRPTGSVRTGIVRKMPCLGTTPKS